MRIRIATGLLALLLLPQAGCVTEPTLDVTVRTDRTEYDVMGHYYVDMTVTIVNSGEASVYFRGVCGGGDVPSRSAERADDNPAGVRLGQEICAAVRTEPQPPIHLPPGAAYVDDRLLRTSVSGSDLAEVTGAFRIVYRAQRGPDPGGDTREIESNRFVVHPPEER